MLYFINSPSYTVSPSNNVVSPLTGTTSNFNPSNSSVVASLVVAVVYVVLKS